MGEKSTPKHIGLGLHQQTRSKNLVNLFSRAGHIISYDQVLQIDTALAEHTLSTMYLSTGSVLPFNIKNETFVYYTADNIDILNETLDGKNTFHATQLAARQRGSDNLDSLKSVKVNKRHQINVPEAMKLRIPPNVVVGKENPIYQNVEKSWFVRSLKKMQKLWPCICYPPQRYGT